VSSKTSIEWTRSDDGRPGRTWGPVLGCKKVSAGCDNCYAIRTAHRLAANPNPKVHDAYEGLTEDTEDGLDWTGVVRTLPERLTDPMGWRKPERIFVNSQSDLFHPSVGLKFTARVWATMAVTRQHTYQILTKRPDVALRVLTDPTFTTLVRRYAAALQPEDWSSPWWPLANAWLGVSIEDQATADERLRKLLRLAPHAAVLWASAEPLLGPIDLTRLQAPNGALIDALCGDVWDSEHREIYAAAPGSLDWLVVGGESGPGARPMHPDWARSIRDQCAAAGVPMLFKQWGAWWPTGSLGTGIQHESTSAGYLRQPVRPDPNHRYVGAPFTIHRTPSGAEMLMSPEMVRVGKKAAGRELDGVTHDAYPSVRSVPARRPPVSKPATPRPSPR
jgi:protein gp37